MNRYILNRSLRVAVIGKPVAIKKSQPSYYLCPSFTIVTFVCPALLSMPCDITKLMLF